MPQLGAGLWVTLWSSSTGHHADVAVAGYGVATAWSLPDDVAGVYADSRFAPALRDAALVTNAFGNSGMAGLTADVSLAVSDRFRDLYIGIIRAWKASCAVVE